MCWNIPIETQTNQKVNEEEEEWRRRMKEGRTALFAETLVPVQNDKRGRRVDVSLLRRHQLRHHCLNQPVNAGFSFRSFFFDQTQTYLCNGVRGLRVAGR